MAVNKVRQKELKALGFLLQNDKEHFAVRILGRAGNYTTEEMKNINYLADKYGRGYLGITTRLQIEIPWVKNSDVEAFMEEAESLGLRHGGTGAKVRPFVSCKGTVCLHGNIDTQEVCRQLEDKYFAKDMNAKFKMNIAGCANNCSKANINDIGVIGRTVPEFNYDKCVGCGLCTSACRQKALTITEKKVVYNNELCVNCGGCVRECKLGAVVAKEKGAEIFVGGRFGRQMRLGNSLGKIFKEEDIIPTIDKIVETSYELGEKGERLSKTLDRVGADFFIEKVLEKIN